MPSYDSITLEAWFLPLWSLGLAFVLGRQWACLWGRSGDDVDADGDHSNRGDEESNDDGADVAVVIVWMMVVIMVMVLMVTAVMMVTMTLMLVVMVTLTKVVRWLLVASTSPALIWEMIWTSSFPILSGLFF